MEEVGGNVYHGNIYLFGLLIFQSHDAKYESDLKRLKALGKHLKRGWYNQNNRIRIKTWPSYNSHLQFMDDMVVFCGHIHVHQQCVILAEWRVCLSLMFDLMCFCSQLMSSHTQHPWLYHGLRAPMVIENVSIIL